jgi:hypothetical protein
MWASPVQILVALGLLWQILGWASIGGLVVIIISLPINYFIGKKQSSLEQLIMVSRDKRAKVTNEVFSEYFFKGFF